MKFPHKWQDTCCVWPNAMLMKGVVHFILKRKRICPFLGEKRGTYFERDINTLINGATLYGKSFWTRLHTLKLSSNLLSLRVNSKDKKKLKAKLRKVHLTVSFLIEALGAWAFCIMVIYACVCSAQVCCPSVSGNSLAVKVKIHHILG